ncbi:MAG: threonine/serine exporter family protein, partial [Myxococcota bacterium]
MSPESSFSAAQSALFLELAEALHRCGMSAHRLEDAMEQVGRVLDIDAEVFATPTMLLVSMNQQTRLIRVTPGDIDLGRLGAVDEIAVWLGRGVLTPDEALMQLRRVMSAPHRYSRRAVIAAFGVLSATASVFFGGGWASMAVGGGLGLIVGWG